jgi:hypothetical protein
MISQQTPSSGLPELPTGPNHAERSTEDAELRAFEAVVAVELSLPVDGYVIGEPVNVTRVRYAGRPRIGLIATCQRGACTYDVSLADVVFPPGSRGAQIVARYHAWLGLGPALEGARAVDALRPHKITSDDITVGVPTELVVLACKSNALRCKLLDSTREVTLRTAVRDEIPGSIITVTPRKQWSHARHPYLSGDVSAVRIDASVLGLVPLSLSREDDSGAEPSSNGVPHTHAKFRMERVAPSREVTGSDLLMEAQDCLENGDYAEADALLTEILALDLRCLEAHAMLGERSLTHWPSLALHHFELGVAIASLSIGEDFEGVLPWCFLDNRPFLRCLEGMSRALHRLRRTVAAEAVLRRLWRLDPAARARVAALDDIR